MPRARFLAAPITILSLLLTIPPCAQASDRVKVKRAGGMTYHYLKSKKRTRYFLVMLHGFGGSGSNYDNQADYMTYGGNPFYPDADPLLDDVTWIAPDGPISVGSGSGSHSWFSRGAHQLNSMASARQKIAEILKAEKAPEEKVIWAGFSQGAMMAVDAALHSKKMPAGLIIEAGAIDGTKSSWQELVESRKGLSFLQFHHVKDDTIPVKYGRELFRFLEAGGLNGNLLEITKPYPDNHMIDPEVTNQPIAEYIQSLREAEAAK